MPAALDSVGRPSSPLGGSPAPPPAEVTRLRSLQRRAVIYGYFSRVFRYPDAEILDWMDRVGFPGKAGLPDLEALRAQYGRLVLCQGPQGAVPSPLHECSYTSEGRFSAPQQMADLAGFYRAFGRRPRPGEDRPDHLSMELEFMALLLDLEVQARDQGWKEQAGTCRRAQRLFLRDHLGRWTGPLATRLAELCPEGVYPALAEALAEFVAGEARRMRVTPRPADPGPGEGEPLSWAGPVQCPAACREDADA